MATNEYPNTACELEISGSETPITERLDYIETKLGELVEAVNGRLARLEGNLNVMVSTYRSLNVELQAIRGSVEAKLPLR